MARTVTVELNGQAWAMPVNYGALRDIQAAVSSPMSLAFETQVTGQTPFKEHEIVSIIQIGVSRAGGNLTEEDIGDAIMESENGFVGYLEVVGEYIGAMISGSGKAGGSSQQKTGGAKKKT